MHPFREVRMARFNALVLAGALGAFAGTALRPGVLEIGVVAALLMAGMAFIRRDSSPPAARSAEPGAAPDPAGV
jgi:hypothetical protein